MAGTKGAGVGLAGLPGWKVDAERFIAFPVGLNGLLEGWNDGAAVLKPPPTAATGAVGLKAGVGFMTGAGAVGLNSVIFIVLTTMLEAWLAP